MLGGTLTIHSIVTRKLRTMALLSRHHEHTNCLFESLDAEGRLRGLALLIMPTFLPAGPALAKSPRAVVELFTSQGCSSCPPADAFLGDLAKRDDVIALTLAVDYWDYLGWKDTFASPAHSKRQAAYAKRRGDGQVYTPQMVLNGRRHAIGSHRSEVLKVLAQETEFGKKSWVPVTLKSDNKAIMVSAGAYSGEGQGAGCNDLAAAVDQDRKGRDPAR